MGKSKSSKHLVDGLGKVWASPCTLIGLAYGGLGYGIGRLAQRWGWHVAPPGIDIGNNAVQFLNNPLTIPGAAITLGNSISYGRGVAPAHDGAYGDPSVNLGRHEQAHTWQYQILGPFFIPVYFLIGGISVRNPLERAAQAFGRGGGGSWWPWRKPSRHA